MYFQDVLMTLERFLHSKAASLSNPTTSRWAPGPSIPTRCSGRWGRSPGTWPTSSPPCRPDDGRYGENPNRFQHYYQYQVILKPDPGNIQELYLEPWRPGDRPPGA